MTDVLAAKLLVKEIKCLDRGFVRLYDVSPRIVPEGKTMECAIVDSARISYGSSSAQNKSYQDDARLVSYLIEHQHTSPLETVRFTFHIKCPLFVAVHFLRHRTASVNQISQRYTVVGKDEFYCPSASPLYSIRKQDSKNHQASIQDATVSEKALNKIKEVESLLGKVQSGYEELLQLGVAREVARFCLPQATYTELYYTMDLNNLMKMLRLRLGAGAQSETTIYAQAMKNLVTPLLPIAMPAFENFVFRALYLAGDEVQALRDRQTSIATSRRQAEYQAKRRLLDI